MAMKLPAVPPIVSAYVPYFALWTAAGLFYFSQAMTRGALTGDLTPWWNVLATYVVGAYSIGLLAPLILWPSRRYPVQRRNWFPRIGLHLVISLLFSLVDLAAVLAINRSLGLAWNIPGSFLHAYRVLLLRNFQAGMTIYWILLAGDNALRYYRSYHERENAALRLEIRAVELQRELADAQLHVLKAQLQPHFLFNALNAIMVLMRTGRVIEAEETLGLLSDLLRALLADIDLQEVSLREELRFTKLYLALEQVRYRDRLAVDFDIALDAWEATVPHLALQPLIENAIRHGISRRSEGGRVCIYAERRGEELEVRILDTGPGLANVPGAGLGLRNVRERLSQLYGLGGRLAIENATGGGVVATMTVPFRMTHSMIAASQAGAACG